MVTGDVAVPLPEGMRRAAATAAWLASAMATTTVVASAVAVRHASGSLLEPWWPIWLRLAELAAAAVAVAGVWAVRADHPGACVGLAVAVAGALLPVWAAWLWLPSPLRAGVLAATPLTVAGLGLVALRWPAAPGSTARNGAWAGFTLASGGAAIHLLGYNPFADPGCSRVCDDVHPLLDRWLTTQSAVTVTCVLTIATAALVAATVVRTRAERVPTVTAAIAGAAGVLATSAALRWASWGEVTPRVPLLAVEPLTIGTVGVAVCMVSARTWRTRAALDRLVTRLTEPEAALAGSSGAFRAVHFAVPGEGRWVDAGGRSVSDEPARGRYVVLSDESGPMLRLLPAGRAAAGEVKARLTPATRLALRNAHMAAVTKARLADVQASQRRVVVTSDAERRRIERDLHDGAQQRLVGVAFHLKVLLGAVEPPAAASLESAEARVRDALAHLRRVTHGIFPTVLADEGLGMAIEELVAASDVPATLDVRVGGDLDAEAAMAAYAAVLAALETVPGPASATPASISVVQDAATLTVRITVPAGPTTPIAVSEFTEVADRVGAVGGRFTASRPGANPTVVTAVFPCAS